MSSEASDILKVKKSNADFKDPEDRIISASKGRPTIVIPFLAQSFSDYCLSDDQFYKYNGKHYELVEDKIIGKAIHDWYLAKGIFPCWSLSKERELMVLLRYNNIIKSVEMDSDDNLLNMNNGTP